MTRSKDLMRCASGIAAALCAALTLSGCGGGSAGGGDAHTYSLSGTVTGLSSNGMILAVDGSSVPVGSGTRAVTLATGLGNDTSYSVTVAAQPAGETCNIGNGSGVVTADVSDISITCVPNTYSIGGTISGLNGMAVGLVLDDGAGTDQISPLSTRFTMPGFIPYGTAYAVTVEMQPALETCTVSGGSGIVSGNVTNVAVSCAPSYTVVILHSFAGGSDGADPDAGLILSSDGNFCGTTRFGGAHSEGTVFEVTTAGAETVLYSFAGGSSDGADPVAGVIQASDGDFYGTTFSGGTGNFGTVFRLTGGGSETVLHSFAGGSGDGANPGAGVIQASDGDFYGTTPAGGANGDGVIFKVTPGGTETVLHSFGGGGDGAGPNGLIQGSDGDFYGTTFSGGADGSGTVFKITPAGAETVLYSFAGGAGDGSGPSGGVIEASDGNFYGTTEYGGPSQDGSVYELTPAGAETVLYFFGTGSGNGKGAGNGDGDGADPYAGVMRAADGNFYGTTMGGGLGNNGTAFDLAPGGVETVMHYFGMGQDGSAPLGDLVQARDGDFYGTASSGGADSAGTVFAIVPLQ